MRKFLFNGSILSAAFGAWTTIQATRNGPKDWRLIVAWISWGCSLALAVGSVVQEANESEARQLAEKRK